jgi:hypothetical protein
MTQAVIVSTARTPIGKAYRGALNNTEGPTMLVSIHTRRRGHDLLKSRPMHQRPSRVVAQVEPLQSCVQVREMVAISLLE